MLKKTVTYKDFNGTERTEDFYFHMTTAELMEIQVSKKGGFGEYMQKIIASDDREEIMAQFKKLLLMSVGQRSEDGRQFKKTQEFRDEFMSTNAYSELFITLAMDAEAGAEFVNGIVPSDFAEQMAELNKKVTNAELPADSDDRPWYDYSREELVALPDEKFEQMFNDLKNPKPQIMLAVAMERRTKQ